MSKDKASAGARRFEDDPTEPVQGIVSIEAVAAGVDDLIDRHYVVAPDPRTRLQFVQFKVPARLNGRAGAVPVISWAKGTKIHIETVDGVKCVTVEGPNYPKPACVPMENVAVFAVFS